MLKKTIQTSSQSIKNSILPTKDIPKGCPKRVQREDLEGLGAIFGGQELRGVESDIGGATKGSGLGL